MSEDSGVVRFDEDYAAGHAIRAEIYLLASKLYRQDAAIAIAVQALINGDVTAATEAIQSYLEITKESDIWLANLLSGEAMKDVRDER